MMRMICLALAMLLTVSAAFAAPQLSDSLFIAAKQAAECLMTGDFDRLAARMPFSGAAPDADEWASFAGNYASKGHAQQEYAVGFWFRDAWYIAVPMREPNAADVEVLLLSSEDGYTFSGYRYANWGQVEQTCAKSDHVVWSSEYVADLPKVYAD